MDPVTLHLVKRRPTHCATAVRAQDALLSGKLVFILSSPVWRKRRKIMCMPVFLYPNREPPEGSSAYCVCVSGNWVGEGRCRKMFSRWSVFLQSGQGRAPPHPARSLCPCRLPVLLSLLGLLLFLLVGASLLAWRMVRRRVKGELAPCPSALHPRVGVQRLSSGCISRVTLASGPRAGDPIQYKLAMGGGPLQGRSHSGALWVGEGGCPVKPCSSSV